jgi:hypothetical protein
VERDKLKKIGIGWTNFAAIAMETKRGDVKWRTKMCGRIIIRIIRIITRIAIAKQ